MDGKTGPTVWSLSFYYLPSELKFFFLHHHAVYSETLTRHIQYEKWKSNTHGILGVGNLNVRQRLVSVY